MLSKLQYILIIITFMMAVACNDEDCTSMNTNIIRIKFDSLAPNGRIVDKLKTFEGIYAKGFEDSIFHKNLKISTFRLPLHPGRDNLTFVFVNGSSQDSIKLSYKSTARFISAECGVEYIFSEIKLLRSSFDSVNVVNKRLTRNAQNADIRILEDF